MTLKLYYDLLSQPSRALYIILNKTKVPFEKCRVDLKKGEHLTEEYREIARNQKAPAIDDDGFKLSESVAIIRYLAREKSIPDHWYPKDSKKQAKVDEYLEWQHNNIRAHCALFFQVKWLIPCLTGEEPNEKKVMNFQRRMSDTLDFMESVWLSPGPWIAGDEISVADLWAACEIEQPRMAGYDPKDGRPVLADWMERVKKELNPYYDEAHVFVNKIAAGGEKAKL